MAMQREEKVVLLFMALGSLAAASWALGDFEADTAEMPITVVAEGTVKSIQLTTDGHLILRLQSSTMPIFVSQRAAQRRWPGRWRRATGSGRSARYPRYRGLREISVKRLADVEILR
ncbi:hypothetical protein P0O24_11920 [Methanotrichaceae archaeon M04Ac]|uniref:Uncharacterized protein n=1 Tax=Candidatus Methanocrinis alkalitolerans TaxID=3033395 RepID=A0ABT5XHU8_9EURY|nr:hypothetical protein [Candidatus Methanocrinis alkalitolerans]MDF0594286.1 hypothetical protein [Candidatus Methanocrinis alkalitolerans]